jgi:RimJ/RimL family protein N-acetyltransferase
VNEYWPLFGIQVAVGDIVLHSLRENDLGEIVRVLPEDAEHDPTAPMWEPFDLDANRRRILLQSYWRSLATWSAESWALYFRVSEKGRTVGVQVLEASQFQTLRTVDSASWIVADLRGRGIGVAMRTAVLALAFEHLGAEFAITSARDDNGASLGVSRRLGYLENGVSRNLSPSGPCTLQHLVLRREVWLASGLGSAVTVSGLDGCADWFGVEVR